MILSGTICDGCGHSSDRGQVSLDWWDRYSRECGIRLIPGTLNIELEEEVGLSPSWFVGDQLLAECWLLGHRSVIIRAKLNESGKGPLPRSLVEVASSVHFRDKYGLQSGDVVELTI